VEKTRYRVEHEGRTWEVDEYGGANAGLVVAECELAAEGESVVPPPWVGAEVSGDHRYANSHLAEHPFGSW
jgi:adenylate cyclase